jgi:hypothetical protein
MVIPAFFAARYIVSPDKAGTGLPLMVRCIVFATSTIPEPSVQDAEKTLLNLDLDLSLLRRLVASAG